MSFNEFNFNLGDRVEDERLKLETQAAALGQRTREELEEERIRKNVKGDRPERPTDLVITNRVQWVDAKDVFGVHIWKDYPEIPGLEVDQTGKYYRLTNNHDRMFMPDKNYEGKDAIAAHDNDWEYYLVGGNLNRHRHLTLEQVKQIELEIENQKRAEKGEAPLDESEEDRIIREVKDGTVEKRNQEKKRKEIEALILEIVEKKLDEIKEELIRYIDEKFAERDGWKVEQETDGPEGAQKEVRIERRGNVVIDGEEVSLTEAARILGVDRSNLAKKLRWGKERVIGGKTVMRL